MANLGWISLHRTMLDWEWYDDINVCRLFTHLLLKANHKDSKWRGTEIKKGSLITGRTALSNQTGLSEQQVRSSLKKLKSTNEITIKTTSINSLISITNWDLYQGVNQLTNQRVTNEQPTSNQRVTNEQPQTIMTNNINNEEQLNKDPTPSVKNEKAIFNETDILYLFNSFFSELPKAIKLNPTRTKRIKKLSSSDLPTIAAWNEYFSVINKSDFLMGRTKKNFQCSFDWILNPANAIKIAEGNYINKRGVNNDPEFNSDEYWRAIAEG